MGFPEGVLHMGGMFHCDLSFALFTRRNQYLSLDPGFKEKVVLLVFCYKSEGERRVNKHLKSKRLLKLLIVFRQTWFQNGQDRFLL